LATSLISRSNMLYALVRIDRDEEAGARLTDMARTCTDRAGR
jgi:thioester reductase-like protein